MSPVVRPASTGDGPALQEIERLAGERFREVGLSTVADDEPFPVQVLARYAAAGRSWVAVSDKADPIGYVLVDVVDGNAHIEQLSVRPDHQAAGVGQSLLEQVRTWASEAGMVALTLTTFAHVPWNAPLYEHLGFRILSEDEIEPGLRQIRDGEAAHGLDPATRVCMRREASD